MGPEDDAAVRLAIEALHTDYVHAIDDDRLEAWPELFAERGRYVVTTAENHDRGLPFPLIYADSRAMMIDRVQSLRHANVYEAQRYRHVVSSTRWERTDGERVRTVSHFVVVRIMRTGESTLFASGRYLDRIVLAPRALFEERIAVLDSRTIDTLLAIPI